MANGNGSMLMAIFWWILGIVGVNASLAGLFGLDLLGMVFELIPAVLVPVVWLLVGVSGILLLARESGVIPA